MCTRSSRSALFLGLVAINMLLLRSTVNSVDLTKVQLFMIKHRLLLIFIGVALVAVASLPFLMSASCLTRPQTPAEQKAIDSFRSMTRNDVLPSEEVVAGIENQFPRSKAAALARMLRARIKLKAGDFARAAALLDTRLIGEQTSLAD